MSRTGDPTSRARLIDLLGGIPPGDDLEREHRDFARTWAAGGSPLYRTRKPDVPATHLVSYLVVVDPHRRELLLVDHRGAGLWLAPGGHVEAGDADPWGTVRRECPEELGVEARPLDETGTAPFFATVARTRGAGPHTDVCLWYAVEATADEITGYDAREFAGIGWRSPRQILDTPPAVLGAHLQRAVRKLGMLGGLLTL